MNREIIFRGKTTTDNRWVYGDLIQYGKYTSIRVNLTQKDGIPNYVEFIVNPDTLSEFTGLVDKNVNKIFENDIVSYIDNPTNICSGKYAVVIDAGFIGFESLNLHELKPHIWCSVIGNIFDNADLVF
jgi:uncharacterized phage protein (TIGR01671 family)